MPSGYEVQGGMPGAYPPAAASTAAGASNSGSMSAVAQLFARLSQEIEEHKPKNCVHFMVDFLCKHYPEHLHGFASIWQMDPDLERERHEVVDFFKTHKISTAVAAHFTNAGYDTLDTLTTLSPDSLVDVEAFNNVKWLPGHKVRLQQIFSEISARVRAYRQQHGKGRPADRQQVRNYAKPIPTPMASAVVPALPAPMPMATAVCGPAAVPMALPAPQMQQAPGGDLFNMMDRNKDGVITRSEFAQAVQPGHGYGAPGMMQPQMMMGGGTYGMR